MQNEDYEGNDVLTDVDLKDIEANYEVILDGLHKKVRASDKAREWLNTELGQTFQKFLAADKLRTMRACSLEFDATKLRALQIDAAAVRKIEVIFGSILADGNEALSELNLRYEGDTDEN